MPAPVSVFLDFNLPNATTWLYFSFLLTVAVFFKFSRLFSIRNLDVLALFLFAPPLLIIQASRPLAAAAPRQAAIQVAELVGNAGGPLPVAVTGAGGFAHQRSLAREEQRGFWTGYVALLVASAYLFLRCLLDLILVQRPLLAPNLSFGGLAWMAFTPIACLSAVAFRQSDRAQATSPALDALPSPSRPHGPESATLTVAREWFDPSSLMMRGFAMVGH